MPPDLISRNDAYVRGLRFYFDGVECRNGHTTLRYVRNGSCQKCSIEATKRSFDKNRTKNLEVKRLRHRQEAEVRKATRTYIGPNNPRACTTCKEILSPECFSVDNYTPSGRVRSCKACVAVSFKRWTATTGYTKRLETAKATRGRLKATNPKLRWAQSAKNALTMRSTKRGETHDITVQWLYDNAPEYCPLLEIALKFDNTKPAFDSAAVDRKNNSLGYSRANCWVISTKANRIKTDATVVELLLLAKNMRRYRAA